jgi:hypothetical protein
MTDAEPIRSDDETRAGEVRRRLVETVHEQLDEIRRQSPESTTESEGRSLLRRSHRDSRVRDL